MLRKSLILVVVVCMLLSIFSGCTNNQTGETPEPEKQQEDVNTNAEVAEKVLVWNNGAEPTTMDPGLNAGTDAAGLIINMYEGLLREIDNEVVPGMAESYTVSDDKLTYVFKLRDAKWSDGKEVTAYDFEFAWNRVLDPEVASPFSWIFEAASIKSFKAIDDKTFEVNLVTPAPYFLGLLSSSTFMPLREDAIDYLDGGWAIDPSRVITNGAYVLAEYETGDKIVLTKNEKYWQADKVNIDRIEALMIVDQVTALTGFESGEIDVVVDVPPAEIPRLISEEPNFQLFPANGSYYFAFNLNKEPFNDIRVRKALTYSIDRTAIVKDVTKGGEQPAHSLIPGVIYDANGKKFNEESGNYSIPYDDSKYEEAKQLLADAGYPNGEGFPEIELLYNTSEKHKAIAETIQQMWKENLNINISLVNMESSVFHQTRVAHDFDVTRGGWYGDYADPLTYLDMFTTGALPNYADWSNEEYDQLITDAKILQGQERFEKFYRADELLMSDFAYLPVYYVTHPTLVNNDVVKNWKMTSRNEFYFVFADIVR